MREPSFTLKIVYLAIFYIIIGSKIITKIFNKFKVTIPSSILKLARARENLMWRGKTRSVELKLAAVRFNEMLSHYHG